MYFDAPYNSQRLILFILSGKESLGHVPAITVLDVTEGKKMMLINKSLHWFFLKNDQYIIM